MELILILILKYKIMEGSTIKNSLRSVISLIDKLRDIKLESFIQLPKIVAVGSQSSGKSSLVEQIVGLDFLPRGSGVVTRRPLEIRMIYTLNLKESYAVFQQLPNQKITNFAQVKESIQLLTEKICGKGTNIIDKAIILTIYSENCPNLTIIDLPGLTRISMPGQPSNIYEVTSEMIGKYMKDPSTIILCVIPANQDITNDEVLHMARKIDKLGERTIGCVTKIDIMDRGTDARQLLTNKGEVPLKLGYVGIKNRSQADIKENKTVAVSLADQKAYFSKSPIYSTLSPTCLGTTSLVTILTKVLQDSIIQFLPDLCNQIKERKAILQEKIKEYGKPIPKNNQEATAYLWTLCNQFLSQYKKCLRGHITTLKAKEKIEKTTLYINETFLEVLKEQHDEKISESLSDNHIYLAIRKYDGSNMPGFPSINSFLSLIDPLIKSLKNPLQHVLNEISFALNHIVELIVSEVAHEYSAFRQFMISKVGEIIHEFKKKSHQYLESVMECEVGYIYTNHQEFFNLLHNSHYNIDKETQLVKKNPLIFELRKRASAYYKILVSNLRDLIPKNIKYFLLGEATKKIEFQIFQSCSNHPEKVAEWLKIDNFTLNQRIRNQKQFETLVKAEQFLSTHVGFAKIRAKDIVAKKEAREKQLKDYEEKQKLKKQKKQISTNKNDKHGGGGESPIKKEESIKENPKDSSKKNVSYEEPKKQAEKPAGIFQNLFGVSDPKKIKQPEHIPVSQTKTNPNIKDENKKQTYVNEYNKQAGKATDKAVDEVFKNETFKKQSTKAVEQGTTMAVQKQFGLDDKTAKMFGQGAGWAFKQDATQNVIKQQAKTNIKEQTQIKK